MCAESGEREKREQTGHIDKENQRTYSQTRSGRKKIDSNKERKATTPRKEQDIFLSVLFISLIPFLSTQVSSKTGDNVEEVFHIMAREIELGQVSITVTMTADDSYSK